LEKFDEVRDRDEAENLNSKAGFMKGGEDAGIYIYISDL
jgi:hypothetical protein